MGELGVGCLLLGVVLIYLLVDPGHLVPHLDEFEVEVSAEEAHLALADFGFLLTQFGIPVFGQRDQRAVAA